MTSPRISPNGHQAEDCLSLNIWTPGTDNKKRPVMVWIHGGGLRMDSANRPPYVGNHLAYQGDVVVVTLNYRQGTIAMLAHPALSDPDTGYFANWNIQDWLFALGFIHRNIQKFGGDPNRVTLFGESGGSVGVNVMAIINKDIRGNLFHRVIGQSGDPIISSMGDHMKFAENFFKEMGCTAENALECIRSKDLETFKKLTDKWGRLWPANDGILIRYSSAKEAIRAGETEGLDWIIGDNGPYRDVGTRVSWETLLEHNKAGGKGYRYYLPSSSGVVGSHGADLPLMFGTYEDDLGSLTKSLVDNSNPSVRVLSKRMIKSWTNFAHTGNPSFKDETLGEVSWPTYESDNYFTMIWDDNPHVEKKNPVTQARKSRE
jgi:carboxylesterase type B